jgi:lipopolysaccharide biosynthesis glycosyltransferase
MLMRRAVVTLSIGKQFAPLAERTHPLMVRYAFRIGAEFVVIDTPRMGHRGDSRQWMGWEKYQLADLLVHYDQILFLDTDVMIRPDCPDLMEFCGNRYGAFNEVPFNPVVLERLDRYCKMAGLEIKPTRAAYYNGGVVVCNRSHRPVFEPPAVLYHQGEFRFAEQTHTTARIHQLGVKCRDLPVAFNAMPGWMKVPDYMTACPVVHLAGFKADGREKLADKLLETWREEGFEV